MGDHFVGSFPGCTRVRPKCGENTCVGLWGQSTVSMSNHQWSEGSGCYILNFTYMSFTQLLWIYKTFKYNLMMKT